MSVDREPKKRTWGTYFKISTLVGGGYQAMAEVSHQLDLCKMWRGAVLHNEWLGRGSVRRTMRLGIMWVDAR